MGQVRKIPVIVWRMHGHAKDVVCANGLLGFILLKFDTNKAHHGIIKMTVSYSMKKIHFV
jgi:hypothetical protein